MVIIGYACDRLRRLLETEARERDYSYPLIAQPVLIECFWLESALRFRSGREEGVGGEEADRGESVGTDYVNADRVSGGQPRNERLQSGL